MDDKEFEQTLAYVKREIDYGGAKPKQRTRQAQSRPPQQRQPVRKSLRKRKMQRRKRILTGMTALFAILLVVLLVLIFKSCSADTSLAGTWRIDETTIYDFDGKNRGVLHTSLNDYPFTYKVSGDSLTIDFDSDAATDATYTYSIKGKILTLTRDDGVYTLTKD